MARGVLFAAAVGFAGCRGVLGVDGYETLPLAAACPTCMDAHCYDETTECAGEPACAALSDCLAKCDDGFRPEEAMDACRVTCNLSTRRTTEMSRVIECAARSCDQCSAAHATFGGLACTRCLEREDPDSLKALSLSIPALEREACEQDCPPSFEDQCLCTDLDVAPLRAAGLADAGSADSGGALLKRLRGVTRCSEACQFTPDWSCLGLVKSLPLAKSTKRLSLHVRLADYVETLNHPLSPSPRAGAEVTACTPVADCTAPSPAVTQEGTGLADLLLEPLRDGAYFGDLAVTWSEEVTGPTSRALFYFFPPLRRNPSWTWRRLVSREAAQILVNDTFLNWENNGGIVWSVAACNGIPAAGVTAKLLDGMGGPEEIVFVSDTFALSKTLKATSSVGLGAVLNVIPGMRTMELKSPEGRIIGTYDFYVSAGAITTLSFAPFTPARP